MKAIVAIDFACNDPSNGEFAGRAGSACYNRHDAEIEASNLHGYAFAEVDGGIRIHGRVFPVTASSCWVGNWSWNRYWLKREDAKALLRHLRKHRWRMTCAPSRLYAWFNQCSPHQERQLEQCRTVGMASVPIRPAAQEVLDLADRQMKERGTVEPHLRHAAEALRQERMCRS